MSEDETRESAPATPEPPTTTDEGGTAPEDPIPFKQFLETVHPSVAKNVSGLWRGSFDDLYQVEMLRPEVRLYCLRCDGPRAFRSLNKVTLEKVGSASLTFVRYFCGDCQEQTKTFALSITPSTRSNGEGVAYKYGEEPTFGIRVPNRVLRLFGEDRDYFIKGRQCENQGLGVGAFAYYRRVVENHKNEIFDEIIKICETVGASQKLIDELGSAKKEISFTKAMKQIKTALPPGLLINGHDPLLALHNALSVGLHNESDAKCLGEAHDVRLVLTDLIERMSLLRQDNTELHGAVQRLIAKKGGV